MASTSPLNLTPTFLAIPPEVRLRIYFYVFEKEQGDECFLSGAYFGLVSEGPISRKSKAERSIEHPDDVTSLGRHPEILRVNHQIYFEAFPVLYSGLVMVDPSKGTWSYKPLKNNLNAYYYGETEQDDFAEIVYDPPLLQGATKPQKLAKFTKVLLIAKFRIVSGEGEWDYDEESGELPYLFQQELTDDLRTSTMIEDFVELLAGCSWADHVDLDIGLVATWYDQAAPGYIQPMQKSEVAEVDALRKIWHKGDIQVADIFLASGILDPLRRLSNVRSWCIELTVECLYGETTCMHERMALDIGKGIKQTRTALCNGHNSHVVPCGLLWKPILEPLSTPPL